MSIARTHVRGGIAAAVLGAAVTLAAGPAAVAAPLSAPAAAEPGRTVLLHSARENAALDRAILPTATLHVGSAKDPQRPMSSPSPAHGPTRPAGASRGRPSSPTRATPAPSSTGASSAAASSSTPVSTSPRFGSSSPDRTASRPPLLSQAPSAGPATARWSSSPTARSSTLPRSPTPPGAPTSSSGWVTAAPPSKRPRASTRAHRLRVLRRLGSGHRRAGGRHHAPALQLAPGQGSNAQTSARSGIAPSSTAAPAWTTRASGPQLGAAR